jgi:hypothetical protein
MHSTVLGISSELLDICDIEVDINFPLKLTKKLVSSPRFKDNNVEKVCRKMM